MVDRKISSDHLILQGIGTMAASPQFARSETLLPGRDRKMISNQIEGMDGCLLLAVRIDWRPGKKEGSERIALEDCSSARSGFNIGDFVETMRAWNCHETEKPSLVFAWEIHFPKPFKRGGGQDGCSAPERHWQKMAI
jgi:hypothetical protein